MVTGLLAWLAQIDARLLRVGRPIQRIAVIATLAILAGLWAPFVPRAFVDYARLPLLHHLQQSDRFGTDTISDSYESRVVLHDVADMYTKNGVAQTPLEAATWSKAASAPYPPAALLIEAGLYRFGESIGIGFYGMILALACLFVGISAWYFLQTRWYVFPLLYLSNLYFGYRFVYVQDDTYLLMLMFALAALVAARHKSVLTPFLMALAIVVKLSPLFYVNRIVGMKRVTAVLFTAVLVAGLIAPYFLLHNYLYIYSFAGTKGTGGGLQKVGAILISVLFAALLWYVERRAAFDAEEIVGWALVPFAMFLAYRTNAARHLIMALLVPDKRAVRNLAVAGGMVLHSLAPSVIDLNAVLPISTAFLLLGLAYHLREIGWAVVADDARHPLRTIRQLTASRETSAMLT